MKELLRQMLMGFVRHGVTAVGAYLAAKGIALSGTDTELVVGAIMIVLSVGWSGVQKLWAERTSQVAQNSAAVASANAGIPVTVTVTPANQPNIITQVSMADQAAAPSVPPGTLPLPAPAS